MDTTSKSGANQGPLTGLRILDITTVPDKDFGSVRMQNVVPRFLNDPGSVRTTGGSIGQDNAEIYGEWLSIGTEEQQRLKTAGVI